MGNLCVQVHEDAHPLLLFLDMIATRCIHNQLLYPGVTAKDHQQVFILHGQHVLGVVQRGQHCYF